MTNRVATLDTETTQDLPVARVLDAAKDACPHVAIVVGYDDAGDLYVASSVSDAGDLLLLLARAHRTLMGLVEDA